EEWVRQHFVHFLITVRSYPPERIANEVCIHVNTTSKRCDTVVYDNYLNPLVIIEYKAPGVNITGEVFDQISRYNSALKVPYLIVSNGLLHYCCNLDYRTMQYRFVPEIPEYSSLP
ncbi:MAG: type I restriction enzyme HsdR N-terminal domain-containing protein, partial [Tannerella sp.]|nr:type I restriction enzyme HsdR N-terminal domain-containing protein [Tannerella sp.]